MFVILDRDGVINYDSENYIKSPAEWKAIPGSLEAIAALKKSGTKVVIASNQSGLGRGYFSLKTLHEIHQKLQLELHALNTSLDGIYFCSHHPDQNCECRKPKPGLLQQISRDFSIDLQQAIVIGDSYRDIQAAKAVHAKPYLVLTGKGAQTYQRYQQQLADVAVFDDLRAVVTELLRGFSLRS
jgi:D-glycero-D-manno-heptose 1,7-bisphosphate phosphatase